MKRQETGRMLSRALELVYALLCKVASLDATAEWCECELPHWALMCRRDAQAPCTPDPPFTVVTLRSPPRQALYSPDAIMHHSAPFCSFHARLPRSRDATLFGSRFFLGGHSHHWQPSSDSLSLPLNASFLFAFGLGYACVDVVHVSIRNLP